MISNKILNEAVRRLVEKFHPEKIILFGSQARGTADEHSDVDILVIQPIKENRRNLLMEMYYALSGLDRIHETRGIHACYDFSATPFAPSGKKSSEEALFPWIASDFGLNDAIESGLVKTPRVVIRDDSVPDAKDYRSRLYHIYEHVRDDLNRDAQEHYPLPDLVINGYYLLGKDWLETSKLWNELGFKTPPVMISVANRTETAARVKHAFEKKEILIDELCIPERILHIDSEVLKIAESQEESANPENNSKEEMDKVKTLELDAGDNATQAELACVVEGKPDLSELSEIDLRDLGKKNRLQKIIFEAAGKIFDQMKPTWKGSREILPAQLIQLVEKFISSEKIRISPSFFNDDDIKRRILITLNMTWIVHHIASEV